MNFSNAMRILYKKRDDGELTLNEFTAIRLFLEEIYEEGYKIVHSPTFTTNPPSR